MLIETIKLSDWIISICNICPFSHRTGEKLLKYLIGNWLWMKLIIGEYLHINNLLNIIAFSYLFSFKYLHFVNSNRFTRNQQRILEQNKNQREDANVSK